VAVLHIFWGRRTSVTEGRQWVQTALARAEATQHSADPAYLAARARALVSVAELAFQLGDNPAALVAAQASMALARQIGEWRTLALALGLGATASAFAGDLVTARAWVEECAALSRQNGYTFEHGYVAGAFMSLALAANEPVPLGIRQETLRLARASGNPVVIGMTTQNVARVAASSGDWDEAYAGFEESATLFQQMRARNLYNASRSEIGHLLRQQGRYQEAAAVYAETMRVWQELGQRPAMAHELECLAFIAAASAHADAERAAALFGAAEALREALGAPMTAYERREYDHAVAQLRAQTDEVTLTAAWARGRALSLDEAVAYALQE
jgi:tetratricopeptide (TPR) repeat protein